MVSPDRDLYGIALALILGFAMTSVLLIDDLGGLRRYSAGLGELGCLAGVRARARPGDAVLGIRLVSDFCGTTECSVPVTRASFLRSDDPGLDAVCRRDSVDPTLELGAWRRSCRWESCSLSRGATLGATWRWERLSSIGLNSPVLTLRTLRQLDCRYLAGCVVGLLQQPGSFSSAGAWCGCGPWAAASSYFWRPYNTPPDASRCSFSSG